jgi:hypothetical protein
MDCPTKIAGKSQFENIKHKDNIHNWLCQCCKYFLLNHKMIEVYISDDIIQKTVCSDEHNTDCKPQEFDNNVFKIEMADYFFNCLDVRDSYIMYVYLYSMEEEIYINRLDEKISDTLINCGYSNMSAEYVRKIKSKSISKARNFFFKNRDNFRRHFPLILSDYKEIIVERRKVIMLKLGICSDSLMDKEIMV